MQSEAGKGSKRRPMQISDKEYASRWDAIWGKADAEKEFRMDDDVCSICGGKVVDGICEKLLEQMK